MKKTDALPEACEKCSLTGGYWEDTGKGLRRCDCARSRMLFRMAELAATPLTAKTPVISIEETGACMEMNHRQSPRPSNWWTGPLRLITAKCSTRTKYRQLLSGQGLAEELGENQVSLASCSSRYRD